MQTESNAFLEHFGVKGMKLGVRRTNQNGGSTTTTSSKKNSKKEILEARARHNNRATAIQRQVSIGSNTFDKATQRKAAANIRKIANEEGSSKDASVGAKLTRGEKVATVLFLGPLGPIVNSAGQKNRIHVATTFIESSKNIKVQDFYDLDKGNK